MRAILIGLKGWLVILGLILLLGVDAVSLPVSKIALLVALGGAGFILVFILGKRACHSRAGQCVALTIYLLLVFCGIYSPIAVMHVNAPGLAWAHEQHDEPLAEELSAVLGPIGEETMAVHFIGIGVMVLVLAIVFRGVIVPFEGLEMEGRHLGSAPVLIGSGLVVVTGVFHWWLNSGLSTSISKWFGFGGMSVLAVLAFYWVRKSRMALGGRQVVAIHPVVGWNEVVCLLMTIVILLGCCLLSWQWLDNMTVSGGVEDVPNIFWGFLMAPFWAVLGPDVIGVLAILGDEAPSPLHLSKFLVDLSIFCGFALVFGGFAVRFGQGMGNTERAVSVEQVRGVMGLGLFCGLGCFSAVGHPMLHSPAETAINKCGDLATPVSVLIYSTGHLVAPWLFWGILSVFGGFVLVWYLGSSASFKQLVCSVMVGAAIAGTVQYVLCAMLMTHFLVFMMPIVNTDYGVWCSDGLCMFGDNWPKWTIFYVLGWAATLVIWICLWGAQAMVTRLVLRLFRR